MAWRSLRWNDCFLASPCNRPMTAFRFIRAVAADARNRFVISDLVEQARQHRCVVGRIVSHFDGSDFQRGCDEAKMELALLAAVIGGALLCLPSAFTQHLDAGTVDQQMHPAVVGRAPIMTARCF